MKRNRSAQWEVGDYFLIPLQDGTHIVAQVIDRMMSNIVSIALLLRRVTGLEDGRNSVSTSPPSEAEIFSALATWRDALDRSRWPIIGEGHVLLPTAEWPNEALRASGWVGARHFDNGLVERFVAAYFCQFPWDGLHDPTYFDKLLRDPKYKPPNPMMSKS